MLISCSTTSSSESTITSSSEFTTTSETITTSEPTTTSSTKPTTTSSTKPTTTSESTTTSTTTTLADEGSEVDPPKVLITNCPIGDISIDIYELEWTAEAGSGDIIHIGILVEKNDGNFTRVFFTKENNAELITFPTAYTSGTYSYQIDNTDSNEAANYTIEINIISEQQNGDQVFTYDLCFTNYTPPITSTTSIQSDPGYPQLVIKEISTSISTYERDDWSHWSDEDGDCQNVRHEVLQDETFEVVTFTNSSGCYVNTGKWYGVYTATYYYSASDLDVDHFVPLKNAHDSGGHEWSLSKKKEYANYLGDSDHLLAVQSGANRSKGALGPEDWKPDNTEYWCEYAYDWIRIKSFWNLSATQREWDALSEMISTCPEGYTYNDATPEPLLTIPTTTTTIPNTSTTIPINPGNTKNCSDFETYLEAKNWFDTYYPYYGDVAGLDGDGDQEPCESLPGAP